MEGRVVGGDVLLAYLVATTIMLLIPGPTVLLVVSYGLAEGRRVVWSTAAGVVLGDFTAMSLSFLGLGAILATSAALFSVLKWVGALYLIWLGIKMWRAEPRPPALEGVRAGATHAAMLWHAFAVTTLNPKSIIFFVAFLPQFIDPARPALPQMVVLGSIFLVLACLNAAGYALLAGTARSAIRRPSILKAVNRTGGTLLIGAGIVTAALRRPG